MMCKLVVLLTVTLLLGCAGKYVPANVNPACIDYATSYHCDGSFSYYSVPCN